MVYEYNYVFPITQHETLSK